MSAIVFKRGTVIFFKHQNKIKNKLEQTSSNVP